MSCDEQERRTNHYRRGADRERDVVVLLQSEGWFASRVAGSRGAADVVALRPEGQMLVQVKANAGTAFADFPPVERAALSGMAQKAGCPAVLAWWPYDRKGARWIPEALWPENERWNRYEIADTGHKTPCWLWLGTITSNGYGRLLDGQAQRVAHRVYYERQHGDVPAGLDLDHLCRVRRCVNPAHLEPVDRSENLRRGARGKLSDYALFSLGWLETSTNLTRLEIAEMYGVSGRTVTRYLGSNGYGRHAARRAREKSEADEHVWRSR